MRFRKLILFSICLLLILPLRAQLTPLAESAISIAVKSGVERQIGRAWLRGSLARPPYVADVTSLGELRHLIQPDAQITVQAISLVPPPQRVNMVTAGPVRASAPPKRKYESPILPFLKEEWELPSPPSRVPPAYEERIPSRYINKSLASLRAECSARGILPWDWETYSRQELAHFLFTYESLKESAKIPSRLDAPETDVKKWAHQQPDFVASNYLSFGEEYEEPFIGPVTNVRMLVVNDVWEEVSALSLSAWQDGHAVFDYAADVDEAINKLTLHPDAYDIVLIDHDLDGNKKGPSLSMWMYDQHLSIPAILYSRVDIGAEWAYKFNFKGRLEADTNPQAVLNFARNILTTGRAYPTK